MYIFCNIVQIKLVTIQMHFQKYIKKLRLKNYAMYNIKY